MTDPVVLVPLDGSGKARAALPVARRLADLEGVPIRILHVCDEAAPVAETARRLGLDPADFGGATLDVRTGDPAQAILAAATACQARLIVLSTHTADVRPAGAIGAAALAVLCGADCPVVLVNPERAPGAGWTLGRMLAPHDGSPGASEALRPAAELARKAGAELVVLQAADAARAEACGSMAPPRYMDQLQHGWPAWSDEFLQRLASLCPLADVRVRLLVGSGEPAAETVRVAAEESVDLIALAWQGHWEDGCAPILKAVLNDAPCPVMVKRVRQPQPEH